MWIVRRVSLRVSAAPPPHSAERLCLSDLANSYLEAMPQQRRRSLLTFRAWNGKAKPYRSVLRQSRKSFYLRWPWLSARRLT